MAMLQLLISFIVDEFGAYKLHIY